MSVIKSTLIFFASIGSCITAPQTFPSPTINVTYQDGILYVYAEGKLQEFYAEGIEELKDVLADIEVIDNRVVRIAMKTDTIRGKVLAISKDFIEIEGYGKCSFPSAYTYKIPS